MEKDTRLIAYLQARRRSFVVNDIAHRVDAVYECVRVCVRIGMSSGEFYCLLI